MGSVLRTFNLQVNQMTWMPHYLLRDLVDFFTLSYMTAKAAVLDFGV